LPFIHWFDWIEPNTTENLSVVVGNMNMPRRMIANPPFKNITVATNPTHSSTLLEATNFSRSQKVRFIEGAETKSRQAPSFFKQELPHFSNDQRFVYYEHVVAVMQFDDSRVLHA